MLLQENIAETAFNFAILMLGFMTSLRCRQIISHILFMVDFIVFDGHDKIQVKIREFSESQVVFTDLRPIPLTYRFEMSLDRRPRDKLNTLYYG